ncbi:MAG: DNA repair protein RecO [Gammaproteobacteria bacterium]
MDRAYVLHRRRYRDTSLIVEFLTREHGRLAAVARGALRPKSRLAGVLQPLAPLSIETRGRGELLTLTKAEAEAVGAPLAGTRLYSAFYVNELIMRLTVAHDPLPALFELYAGTLEMLAGDAALEPALRRFERDLLDLVGLGMNLEHDALTGAAIQSGALYDYVADRGPAGTGAGGCAVHGATLLALAGRQPWSDSASREAKRLMRYVVDHHLDGRPLAARELFAPARARKS